ncbi:MAG: sulfur carrier protein ThiS [Planctomycetota bacterium]|nr:sulfur carrier protein ThiS [Planctomycetota bacterium]
MKITLNGEARELDEDASVTDLLEMLQVQSRQVAVEVNLELVPRHQHPARMLASGDCVEVVTLVGGG